MITVLMATRNRAQILRYVLEGYCDIEPPTSGWKLVIIDNGSSDNTHEIITSYASRLPLYLFTEAKVGKNNALNTGLGMVEGELTVLTDDDVFPYASWLPMLQQAANAYQEYSIFGGVVLPRWEVPPPPWIKWIEDIGPIYSISNPLLKEGPIPPFLVFGPNMAVRTNVFQSGIRFNPNIGPCGVDYPMGSETELVTRLGRQGHKAWYVKGAVVEHFIRQEQLDRSWVLNRAFRWGRGRYRMSQNAKLWMGLPRHLFRDIPKEALIIAAAWASFQKRNLFLSRWRFNILLGIATEALVITREKRARIQSAPNQLDSIRDTNDRAPR